MSPPLSPPARPSGGSAGGAGNPVVPPWFPAPPALPPLTRPPPRGAPWLLALPLSISCSSLARHLLIPCSSLAHTLHVHCSSLARPLFAACSLRALCPACPPPCAQGQPGFWPFCPCAQGGVPVGQSPCPTQRGRREGCGKVSRQRLPFPHPSLRPLCPCSPPGGFPIFECTYLHILILFHTKNTIFNAHFCSLIMH